MHTLNPLQILDMEAAGYLSSTRPKRQLKDALATIHEFKKPCLTRKNGEWNLKEKSGETTMGTNAPCKPEFEGQLVKFRSPHNAKVVLLDEAIRNDKYGWLEWAAVNPNTTDYTEKLSKAMWA